MNKKNRAEVGTFIAMDMIQCVLSMNVHLYVCYYYYNETKMNDTVIGNLIWNECNTLYFLSTQRVDDEEWLTKKKGIKI